MTSVPVAPEVGEVALLEWSLTFARSAIVIGLCLSPLALLLTFDVLAGATISDHFFAFQDAPVGLLFLGFFLAAAPLSTRILRRVTDIPGLRLGSPSLAGIACVVLLVNAVGVWIVFERYPLSLDEFMAEFDAAILRDGHLLAIIPEEWRPLTDALQPVFRLPIAGDTHWASLYLPVNAALRAGFDVVIGRDWASPAMAALSVPVLYAVALRLFDGDRATSLVALLLYVTSSQFVVTAMTPYAMTAHLLFNLAWLWLVLRDRPWSHTAAILLSFLACGLHQVVFHPLFAFPFVLLMWLEGRRRLFLVYVACFAVIGLFWMSYWSTAQYLEGIPRQASASVGADYFLTRLQAMIARINPGAVWWMIENAFRLVTWQNPMLFVLVVVAARNLRSWPRTFHALGLGIAALIAATLLIMPFQGHGWGYRYLHGFLGSFALIGALGWKLVHDRWQELRAVVARQLAVASAFAIAILLPVRLAQAHVFVHPYVVATKAIDAADHDIVVVDWTGVWYGIDLVRNSPGLENRPKVVSLHNLTDAGVSLLCERRNAIVVDHAGSGMGFIRAVQPDPRAVMVGLARRDALRACGVRGA